jgi:hypothetical protein
MKRRLTTLYLTVALLVLSATPALASGSNVGLR